MPAVRWREQSATRLAASCPRVGPASITAVSSQEPCIFGLGARMRIVFGNMHLRRVYVIFIQHVSVKLLFRALRRPFAIAAAARLGSMAAQREISRHNQRFAFRQYRTVR